MEQRRRSLLAVHRRDQEEEASLNNAEGGKATGEVQRDRDDFSNEGAKVDDGTFTAEEWNRDVDIIDEAAGTAAAADKEIPKTNNSGDDGTTSGMSIRVTIPPLLLTLSPTPERLAFSQVRTIHDAAERTIETYFASLNSDDNDRNILEDGIKFSYSKLLGVTLDEWVGPDGRSICGADVQDARDNLCSQKQQPKTCVYGSTAEEDVCSSGELCFANISPSCDDDDRRRLIRGPAQRHLATDAYTVIQIAGGIANFRVVSPAAAPNEKRLGRLSEKAIEKGLVKALAGLNDPAFGGIVDVTATPLSSSDAPFLGIVEEKNEMETEAGGTIEVVDAKEDEAVDTNVPEDTNENVETNDVLDGEDIEEENEEEETPLQNEETPMATEPDGSTGERPTTESETAEQPPESMTPSGEEIPSTTTESSDGIPTNDIPPVVRDPPTESSGTVIPGVPLEPVEGGSAVTFKTNAEMPPSNNSPLVAGVVTGMILLTIGLVFSVIAFRRHKHRNKGNIEGDADNLIGFEGRHESDLEASESLGKSSPVLATIKETEGEANEEGSGATDESSSNSALNVDEPENLVSPTELSSIAHVRSRSPPRAQQQEQQDRQLQKQQLHELLDQDMISISETTVSHTDTSLGQGASLRPSESFEIRRHFESITVRKDMMVSEITTGMESHGHHSTSVINTELARVPKNVDVEDRGNLITYPRHLQQGKGRQHRPTTGLNIQSEV